MDNFLDRAAKRQRTEEDEGANADVQPPSVIVSWNVNSLKIRCERREIGAAVARFLASGAQALVLQEVRLKPEDRAGCEHALRAAGLTRHRFFWSLHPGAKRYSGVALIVEQEHAPLTVRYDFKGLADPAIKYPALSNSRTSSQSSAGDDEGSSSSSSSSGNPEQEGRVIIAEYPHCWLVCVYVPMCSWYGPGRARRAAWDARLASALQALQRGVAPAAGAAGQAGAPCQSAEQSQGLLATETAGASSQPSSQPDPSATVAPLLSPAASAPTAIPTNNTGNSSKPLKASKITSFFTARSAPAPIPAPAQPAQQQPAVQGGQETGAGGTAGAAAAPTEGADGAAAGLPAAQRASSAPPTASQGSTPVLPGPCGPVITTRTLSGVGAGIKGKPVVLIGDLNVCHTPLDVSHPEFFAAATKPRNAGGGGDPGLPGQPGYTQEERERFGRLLLRDTGLVDTYRQLHPAEKRLTWGYASNFEVGRYAGKYMGLDYTLVSQGLWEAGAVTGSDVMGASAADCHGSDHVPIVAMFDWSKLRSSSTGAP